MKKSISILFLILVFSFLLSISCYAVNNTVTFSDDFQTLYYDGNSYSKANTDLVNCESYGIEGELFISDLGTYSPEYYSYDEQFIIKLTDEQKKILSRVYVYSLGENHLFMNVELYFKDGTTLWVNFVSDDVKNDYIMLTEGNIDNYMVKYLPYSADGDILKPISKDALLSGNKTTIDNYNDLEYFNVVAKSDEFYYTVTKGIIFVRDNEYYYFDFKENGVCYDYEIFDINIDKIEVHKLNDTEAITQIDDGLQEYYNSDYGYLINDTLRDSVAKLFFILVFALIPIAIFVLTVLLASKSQKGLYKKLLLTSSVLSFASLATFLYIAFSLFNK